MNKTFFLSVVIVLLSSCSSTKKIVYMQDVQIEQQKQVADQGYIRIQPMDMLSIIVSSKDPQLAAMFNLPRFQQTIGNANLVESNRNGQTAGYTVDSKGDIDFPVLGTLTVKGMMREDVANLIKKKLIAQSLVKDAVVTVDFINMRFSVLGEVTRPGQFQIYKDQITLLEALSMAGDLTIQGKRDCVLLTRQYDNKRITYEVDLRSTRMFDSPAFHIQQNDVIYVEPNAVRANQSTVNGNSLQSIPLWMSVVSLLTTLGVLLFK